ncbi:MAG: histidine phosphatase family protein, partial [Pseudomonadales bacterium]|nr:histidine phosphatase family protein [Pseudomonadales bacterium]
MKHLYFVRHGQTEWNAVARMQGQWNSDLSELGRAQARVSGALLAGRGIEAMFASPLDRTRQTAALINEHLNLPVTYDDRLKEWDCGDWSGHLYAEVAER